MKDSVTGIFKKSEMDRLMKQLSYETVEMVWMSSHKELHERWMKGDTK